MKKLKFAIIGCGRISKNHVKAIIDNRDRAQLVSVCDISKQRATLCKEAYENNEFNQSKVSAFSDFNEMLDKEDIDVVAIATESGYHSEIAIHSMIRGKHVLVEKPMSLSIEDADKMIECANNNDVKLCVCHQNRFNPAIVKLRKVIEDNSFGKLINGTARILWNRNMDYYNQAPWRGTWKLDGGTLMNQCIHNIDLLQWMLGGEITSVYSQCGTFLRNIEGEDFGSIIIRFKNGAIGIVEGSACVYPKNLEETLSIFGEKGTAVIGGMAVNEIKVWRLENEDEEYVKSKFQIPINNVYGFGHTPLYGDFINSIIENKNPLVNGEEGKKALSIVLAAYKSQKTNTIVKFPLDSFSTMDMVK